MTDHLIQLLNGLREEGKIPRVHPNGFIQLDMSKAQRLHCWSPSLPYRQKTYHPVHNHIFNLVSEVQVGRLINVNYDIGMADEEIFGKFHEEWRVEVTGDKETVLVKQDGAPVLLVPSGLACVQRGQKYELEKFCFHESVAVVPTITVMTKYGLGPDAMEGPNSSGATVLVPQGVTPDNDFLRADVDTDKLWEIMYETAATV